MTLSSKTATMALLSTVTPSNDKATLDTYRDGLAQRGLVIPADADMIVVRELAVPASGSVVVALDDFRLSTATTTPHYNSDGEDTLIERIYALAVIPVSQDPDAGELFILDSLISGYYKGVLGSAYGTITLTGDPITPASELGIGAETWIWSAGSSLSAYELDTEWTTTEIAEQINADSSVVLATVVSATEILITVISPYTAGSSMTFTSDDAEVQVDGGGSLTGGGDSGINMRFPVADLEDGVLLAWKSGILTNPGGSAASITLSELIGDTEITAKVIALGASTN